MSRKRLYLIDGMSHIYRAYYAIRGLSNSRGLPTNAVYGFTSMLRKLIQDEKPDYVGVAFDAEGPTVRHEKFEAYKATRKPMPEDLAEQIPYIRKVCEVFRVPVIEFPGYEADDVIGTLSLKGAEKGLTSIVVTSDKDMFQLVSEHVLVLDAMKDNLLFDDDKVVEKMGVRPDQIPDLLGLWGDSSDNIPGAPGIGEKGAKELIRTFGGIEETLKSWEQVRRKTYRESLRDNAEQIRLSRELATIRRDLPIELDLHGLLLSEPDRKAAFELFASLEFKGLMREFLDEGEKEVPRAEWLAGEAAAGFIETLAGAKEICFSLHTEAGLLGRSRARAVCLQADEGGRAAIVDLRDSGVAKALGRALGNSRILKICWDAKPCLLSLERAGVRLDANVADGMLLAFLGASHIGDYSLKRWALEQIHVSLPEEDPAADLDEKEGRRSVAEGLAARLDATRRLHALLSTRLDELELRPLYEEIELPLVPVLADMERAGIRLRSERLEEMSREMEGQIAELTRQIYEAAGTEFNINSPKQLGEILFEKLNLPTSKKTRKTKGYSTDQTVLEELAQSYDLPRLVLDYRQLAKLKSTYVDALPGLIHPETGRVHTFFNQTGAATGRLSSSDPNLQNIPVRTDVGRRIREAFVPEDGNLLVSADYSQVELRVLAHLSEDPVLGDAFRNNQDIHTRTAREVFGEAALENPAECRRRAKVINFGIVYGLSAFGMAQRLGIPRGEAQAFIDAYFERYKRVREWVDRTLEEARSTGMVRTLFGRVRPMPEIRSRDYAARQFAERTAVNTPIQGTAADIIKIAMIRIHKALQGHGLSGRILLQVHDELVLEVPSEGVDQTQALVREAMEHAAELRVPLIVDMSVADNWMDMK